MHGKYLCIPETEKDINYKYTEIVIRSIYVALQSVRTNPFEKDLNVTAFQSQIKSFFFRISKTK